MIFTDLVSKKSRKKASRANGAKRQEKPASRPGASASPGEVESSMKPDGLEVGEYARLHGLEMREVWGKIAAGELVGRADGESFYVFSELPPIEMDEGVAGMDRLRQRIRAGAWSEKPRTRSAEASAETRTAGIPAEEIPAVEVSLPTLPRFEAGASQALVTIPHGAMMVPEVALLLDHLSLAKEENREIIRFTEESIRRVSEMSEQIVAMKDSVIAEKEDAIDGLKSALTEKDFNIRRLRQQVEDLEMLTRTLGEEGSK